MIAVAEEYRIVLQNFLTNKLSVSAFQATYLGKFKGESRRMPDNIFQTLDALFGDVDAFTFDPELRAENPEFYISEAQLRERVAQALAELG